MSKFRPLEILGSGLFLPAQIVSSLRLDSELGVKPGTVFSKTGVLSRHWVTSESASLMAHHAGLHALAQAGLTINDIDVLISASATMLQPIPYNAALYLQAFGTPHHPVQTFDVNMTCLGFVAALDVASYIIQTNPTKKVLIIASEIASIGLHRENIETYGLFGDGAVAFVVGHSGEQQSGIMSSHFLTMPDGSEFCQVRGGGTKLHARFCKAPDDPRYYFEMDGGKLLKHVLKELPEFLRSLLDPAEYALNDIDMVVPHQASGRAMKLLQQKLAIKEDRWMQILETHGNMIAASIPAGLHLAILQGKLKRGQTCLLAGTSAGLSIGGVLLRY